MHNMSITEMRSYKNASIQKIENEILHNKVKVAPIKDKMFGMGFRWLDMWEENRQNERNL